MTYQQALKRGQEAGASQAGPEELLALVCDSLASIHAINPALDFEGAKKRRLSAKQVAKVGVTDPVALGDLIFA